MAITPAGLPPWAGATDFTQYGGDLNKANYQSQGVVNARTDLGADQFARMTADQSAVTRTGEFGSLEIVMNSAGDPTVNWVKLMTGKRSTSYTGTAPPAGFPTVATVGAGVVTVTFDASYDDEYGVASALSLKAADPRPSGGNAEFCSYSIASDVIVTVNNFSFNGTPTDGTVCLSVWAG